MWDAQSVLVRLLPIFSGLIGYYPVSFLEYFLYLPFKCWFICNLVEYRILCYLYRKLLLDVLNLVPSRNPIFPLHANFPSFGDLSPPLFLIGHMDKRFSLLDLCAVSTQIYDGV